MNIVENILAAIVVLGGLVTFHEFGHFLAARLCGVHVIAFSFGFGKPLVSWQGRKGTRFMISMLPLGGYVRLLGDADELEAGEALHGTTMAVQPVWKRAIIMVAGPVANFVLAIVVSTVIFLHGVTGITPVIGDVSEGGWAASGGLRAEQQIQRIDDQPTPTWSRVEEVLDARSQVNSVTIETTDGERYVMPALPAEHDELSLWQRMGVTPWQPVIPPIIGDVMPDTPAAQAGLSNGARIVAIDDQPVASWSDVLTHVRGNTEHRAMRLSVQWSPNETPRTVVVQPKTVGNGHAAVIGIQPRDLEWPSTHLQKQYYPVHEALMHGVSRTWGMTTLTAKGVWQLVSGAASPRSIGGPVMIAQVAGASARSGLETFLDFLAYLSVSLGIFNLLPIPMLDGGQLVYLLAEAIKGRPLSMRVQLWGRVVGLIVVGGLMVMAFYFDLVRTLSNLVR